MTLWGGRDGAAFVMVAIERTVGWMHTFPSAMISDRDRPPPTQRKMHRPQAQSRDGNVSCGRELRCKDVSGAARKPCQRTGGWCSGSSKRKVLPSPSRLTTLTSPPCNAITCFTIESPRPVPPFSRERALSTR